MSRSKTPRTVALLGLIVGIGVAFDSSAFGQGAVAFVPIVSPLFSGADVEVTPVVSPDRRYVRMGLDVSFTHVNGFTTYSVPAAVGGGPGGPGALGGLGGLLGGGGGGGGRAGSLNQNQGPLAGPFALNGNGNPPNFAGIQDPEAANWPKISTNDERAAEQDTPIAPAAASGAGQRRSIQANIKAAQVQRAAALRASRRQVPASARRVH
jgi:hypothetical protein